MRVLPKATMDTEKANELIRSGKLPGPMKETLERLRPEAACFGPVGGRRTALPVLDMQDSSDLPSTDEPFFTHPNAEVETVPVMNVEDMQKGLSGRR
ncbi:hypothetical protein [Streptomyces caelestis]|uniref:hypothetical protein n=1 Tax=Streptomyces caelestis TaxID=36816 RepID=UPI00364CD59C